MKKEGLTMMKAIALCYKPYLKPEEAQLYCNLGHTQLTKRLEEYRVYKTNTGYFRKADLDRMMEGKCLSDHSNIGH